MIFVCRQPQPCPGHRTAAAAAGKGALTGAGRCSRRRPSCSGCLTRSRRRQRGCGRQLEAKQEATRWAAAGQCAAAEAAQQRGGGGRQRRGRSADRSQVGAAEHTLIVMQCLKRSANAQAQQRKVQSRPPHTHHSCQHALTRCSAHHAAMRVLTSPVSRRPTQSQHLEG